MLSAASAVSALYCHSRGPPIIRKEIPPTLFGVVVTTLLVKNPGVQLLTKATVRLLRFPVTYSFDTKVDYIT